MHLRRLSITCAAAPVALALAIAPGAASTFAPGYGPCSIVVVVRDRAGRPIPGAIVDAIGPADRTVSTSAAGVANFIAVPAGNYALRARTSDQVSTTQNVVVTRAPAGANLVASGGAARAALGMVSLQLQPESIGGALEDEAVGLISVAPAARTPAFDLARSGFVDVGGLGSSGSLRIAGGDVRAATERFDGIPLPDALRGTLLVAGAPALVQSEALARGAQTLGERPGPGSGGILAFTTRPLGPVTNVDAVLGAGSHGAQSDVTADARLGPLAAGMRFGDVTPGAEARSFVARLALSPVTQVDAEAYRLDDREGLTTGPYAVTVRSAGISTSLGLSRLGVSTYDSGFTSTGAGIDDRTHGIVLRYDGTLGPAGVALTYARDAERAVYGDGTAAGTVASRLAVRSEYVLSPAVRAEATVAQSQGTLFAVRRDVATTLALDLAPVWVLRLGTRSGFTPAPLDLVAREPFAAIARPATTFDTSASLSRTTRGSTLAFDVFRSRENDRFAALPEADVRGLTAALTTQRAAGLGIDLSSTVARVRTYGTPSPERDASTTLLARELGLDGDPAVAALRGRAGLTYGGRFGLRATFGATYLDAPNALAPTALVLGDFSVAVPLGRSGVTPFALALRGHDVFGGAFARGPAATGPEAEDRRDLELVLERLRR